MFKKIATAMVLGTALVIPVAANDVEAVVQADVNAVVQAAKKLQEAGYTDAQVVEMVKAVAPEATEEVVAQLTKQAVIEHFTANKVRYAIAGGTLAAVGGAYAGVVYGMGLDWNPMNWISSDAGVGYNQGPSEEECAKELACGKNGYGKAFIPLYSK